MIHAYDKVYLDKAQTALARMLDFSVYELHYGLSQFWNIFITSDISKRFSRGDFTVLVGKSGIELAYEVLEETGMFLERKSSYGRFNRSEEYWVGWALAYYQWESGMALSEITEIIEIETIQGLYHPYHEMDIRQFVDKMNELYLEKKVDTNLKIRRKLLGISQKKLAELSNVPLRTIQQYEQRQKDINKAQIESLIKLASVLCCKVDDLVEWVN